MLTDKNIRKTKLALGKYNISISGKYKFNMSRKINSLTRKEFIELANEKFFEKYNCNWNGLCRGTKKLTDYDKVIHNRWSSINQRTSNGKYNSSNSAINSPQYKSYHRKNITVNMTKDEFITWMLSVEETHNKIIATGQKSSIDRIDDNKGYEIGNLQLISLHENIEKRVGKICDYQKPEEKLKNTLYNKKVYDRNLKGIDIPKKAKIVKPYISNRKKIKYDDKIFLLQIDLAKFLNIGTAKLCKAIKSGKIKIEYLPSDREIQKFGD